MLVVGWVVELGVWVGEEGEGILSLAGVSIYRTFGQIRHKRRPATNNTQTTGLIKIKKKKNDRQPPLVALMHIHERLGLLRGRETGVKGTFVRQRLLLV